MTVAKALPHAAVTSTDIAREYLPRGEARAAAAGLSGRVSFQVADAEELEGFGEAGVDAVTCSLGEGERGRSQHGCVAGVVGLPIGVGCKWLSPCMGAAAAGRVG